MALEIEHKYLVKDSSYRGMATASYDIKQGYLSREPERTVRVRTFGDKGFITVKGVTRDCVRAEFEYEIPLKDASELLAMCLPPVIEKRRYIVPFEGKCWEVDEFAGALQSLVLAEIELSSEHETYAAPPFIGENVTGNPAYYNSNLSSLVER